MTDVLHKLLELPSDTPIEIAGKKGKSLGLVEIPEIFVDNTDRNRTSPFAFTGNRFEFRAFSSSAFTPSEAAKFSAKNPTVTNGQYNPEEYDASRFKSNSEALDLSKQLAKKLVIEIPSTSGQGKDRYIIDSVNRDGTQFGVYKELTIKASCHTSTGVRSPSC